MRALYLLCGISFSGKSRLAAAMKTAGLSCISLDDINAERGAGFGGEGIAAAEWERTHCIARERFGAAASAGDDVVIDDTNCYRWIRQRWRDLAAQSGYRTRVIFLETPLDVIDARRKRNATTLARHQILQDVFEEHVRTFELPADDEDVLRFTPGDDPAAWIAAHLRS